MAPGVGVDNITNSRQDSAYHENVTEVSRMTSNILYEVLTASEAEQLWGLAVGLGLLLAANCGLQLELPITKEEKP